MSATISEALDDIAASLWRSAAQSYWDSAGMEWGVEEGNARTTNLSILGKALDRDSSTHGPEQLRSSKWSLVIKMLLNGPYVFLK